MCFFNLHVNSTYYRCFECGKHLELNSYMSVRMEFLREIDFSYTELSPEDSFYGLPYRRYKHNFGKKTYDYGDLRYDTLVKTTRQSMLITKNQYTFLIF